MIAVELPLPVIALGAIVGLTYGLLAVGLVLVYRSNRLINFAHGEVGAFAAVALGVLVNERGWPYYAALPCLPGPRRGIGIAIEVMVVRRLQQAPRLMGVVATLGVGQLLVVASALLSTSAGNASRYPSPPGLPTFDLGSLQVTQAYSGMLIFAPLVVIGIAVFLRRSPRRHWPAGRGRQPRRRPPVRHLRGSHVGAGVGPGRRRGGADRRPRVPRRAASSPATRSGPACCCGRWPPPWSPA